MKDTEKIHKLLALTPALEFHLKEAEKIRKQISLIKLKDLRRK